MTLKVMTNDITDADEENTRHLDTRVPRHVRIINGTLDDDPDSPSAVVLHGRIDPNTLRFLRVDNTYQRPLGNRRDIYDALKAGVVVPSVEIGVRGTDFECDGSDVIIRSDAFIIDGWQRVGTALQLLEQNPNHSLRIFGSIHFGTEAIWERHRFTELNKNIKKVSPNLHLRNMRDSNRGIATLYGLSHNDKGFALYKKVSWAQNMTRDNLLTALVLARVARQVHSHLTGTAGGSTELIARDCEAAAATVGLDIFRRNLKTFFGVIDECWGLREIEYKRAAPQLRAACLVQIARMFSLHIDFWDQHDRTLFVSANMRRKLAKFPLNDPSVRNLATTGGGASKIFFDLLLRHMNSGKRTGQLRSRYAATA